MRTTILDGGAMSKVLQQDEMYTGWKLLWQKTAHLTSAKELTVAICLSMTSGL